MKCFMHPQKEAISVCKKCGKAMCADCSSYTEHSGICPTCKKEEYEIELSLLQNNLRKNTITIVISAIFVLLFVVLAIVFIAKGQTVVSVFFFILTVALIGVLLLKLFKRKPMIQRIKYLTGEITKISRSLLQGSRTI